MLDEIASIVKNAADLDRIPSFAHSIKNEMPWIVNNPERGSCAVAAEPDVVCPGALNKNSGALRGTWTNRVGLKIANCLRDQRFVPKSGVPAELLFAPDECVEDVTAGGG